MRSWDVTWHDSHMDATEQHARIIAQRMTEARELVGVPVDVLADRSSVEAGVLETIEKGHRYPTSSEVASVSGATGLPVGWFLEEREQLVASRRAALDGGVSSDFDVALEALAFRARKLRDRGIITVDRGHPFTMPQSHDDTMKGAEAARAAAGEGLEPISDLTAFCEKLGLLAFSKSFVGSPFEGAVTEIQRDGERDFGVALVATRADSMRPRFTLAHELGHWLFGTTYADACGRSDVERFMNSFAAHLLMPEEYVHKVKAEYVGEPARLFVMAISARCGVSWTATLTHLFNLGTITQDEFVLEEKRWPTREDFQAAGFDIPLVDALSVVPTRFQELILDGYQRRAVSKGLALEALFGAVSESELPPRDLTQAAGT
ncbi:hypothetical protein CAFEA_08010 [Corynebacterium afermentans subsp. afermentans]|uniref:Zn-dependent peptidase ImmA, M78 family n=2 Tax=Corynebacterium afermentans TaxID=38286 RepID=A0A9X8R6I7_9CORY|nr:hypothetical protein Caferm_03835 [Corynebacterium afermentans subsp. afermentans]WJY57189.1 hypothetical protein CAFEA_08010 [Corynebacterium afermentans subsp. afermentans]SIQ70396.1 Zn-dependent peptidase ImmA, M78 family [Corynebacterium afermentans]